MRKHRAAQALEEVAEEVVGVARAEPAKAREVAGAKEERRASRIGGRLLHLRRTIDQLGVKSA